MSVTRQLFILVVVALLGGGYYGWQHYPGRADTAADTPQRQRDAPTVETAIAEVHDLDSTAEAVGSTRARRAVEISPLAPGRVIEINFSAGQSVKAGDVLLRLDEEIQQADLTEAEARLKEARAALKRASSLSKTSSVAASSLDTLDADVATAEADRDRAERRLRDRTVTAPFNGIVGFSRVELGSRVKEGDPVTTLDDLSLVEVEFSVPEGLFGQVAPGQPVIATAAAFPGREFNGQIHAIDSRIDPVARAFRTRALVANPDRSLPSGMFMHVTVLLASRQALTIPETAIVVEAGDTFVYAVRSGAGGDRAERRSVTLGQRGFGSVEVLAGLVDGDEVIVRGQQRVRDGAPVKRHGEPGKPARGADGAPARPADSTS